MEQMCHILLNKILLRFLLQDIGIKLNRCSGICSKNNNQEQCFFKTLVIANVSFELIQHVFKIQFCKLSNHLDSLNNRYNPTIIYLVFLAYENNRNVWKGCLRQTNVSSGLPSGYEETTREPRLSPYDSAIQWPAEISTYSTTTVPNMVTAFDFNKTIIRLPSFYQVFFLSRLTQTLPGEFIHSSNNQENKTQSSYRDQVIHLSKKRHFTFRLMSSTLFEHSIPRCNKA